jgi:hypothetical protein
MTHDHETRPTARTSDPESGRDPSDAVRRLFGVDDETRAESVDAPETPVPTDFEEDIIVLPLEVDDEGRGLYDDSVLTIVKEFRIAGGVGARYQHPQDERTWIGEKAVPTEVLNLIIGIGSNAGWAALCWLLRRRYAKDQVRVRVGRLKKTKSEVSWQWYSVRGSGAAVSSALSAIERPQHELGSDGQEEAEGAQA